MPRLLITGITGLIGKSVLNAILAEHLDYQISAFIRPDTTPERYAAFRTQLEIVKLDLADTAGVKQYLADNVFDVVLHIGALRGGRNFSRDEFIRSNLTSTQLLVEHCLLHQSKLLYCSSVGVYGAIPEELPANNETERNADNCYHYTKIESERFINRAVMRGLNAAVLRPSIVYGRGDLGFPYQLVRLVDKRFFPLINKRIWIHLCHIDTVTSAFMWLLKNDFKPGLALNVADREPVQLHELVNFVSRQLRGDNYDRSRMIDQLFFRLGERVAKMLRNELWVSRFQLISRSWFYYVADTYALMELKETFTIPGIQITIADYQGK